MNNIQHISGSETVTLYAACLSELMFLVDTPGFLDTGMTPEQRDQLLANTLTFVRENTTKVDRIVFCISSQERAFRELHDDLSLMLEYFGEGPEGETDQLNCELLLVMTKVDDEDDEEEYGELAEKFCRALMPDGLVFTGNKRIEALKTALAHQSKRVLMSLDLPTSIQSTRALKEQCREVTENLKALEGMIQEDSVGLQLIEARIKRLKKQIEEIRSWWFSGRRERESKEDDVANLEMILSTLKAGHENKNNRQAKEKALQQLRAMLTKRERRTRGMTEQFWNFAKTKVRQAASAAQEYWNGAQTESQGVNNSSSCAICHRGRTDI